MSISRVQTAKPSAPPEFSSLLRSWQFNTTSEINDLPPENVIVDGSISVATYVPLSEMDYGTLMCWGRNELGRQRRPCVFHVIPAGRAELDETKHVSFPCPLCFPDLSIDQDRSCLPALY